jgi:hypothetical protein
MSLPKPAELGRKDRLQTTWPKLEKHPDAEELDRRIANGDDPPDLAAMLVHRYPDKPTLHIDHTYLYRYRRAKYPELAEKRARGWGQYKADKYAGDGRKREEEEADIATRIMDMTGQTPNPPEPRRIFTDEQLMRWVGGIEGMSSFVEDMIIERGNKVKLQEYQYDMGKLFLEEDLVCIIGAGQIGKDFMMQNMIIWYAITHAGTLQVILCATQAQSLALMNRILDKVAFSEDLEACYATTLKKPEAMITWKNGSRVLFLTAKSRVAGHTDISILYINEARDIREDEVTRVTPLLGISRGKLIVLSRPRFREGYFWQCASSPAFKTITIPTSMNEHFSRETLENHRATMSPALFKIEHLGQFADAGSSYISEKKIDDCSAEEYDFKAMVADPDYEYSLGIDWGRYRDSSIFIVIGQKKKANKDGTRKRRSYFTS